MTAQDTVNLRAVEVANQALGQIAGHKDDCARRQDDIMAKFAEIKVERQLQQAEFRAAMKDMRDDMNTKLDRITSLMRQVGLWIFMSLVSACAWLFFTYVLPKPFLPAHAADLVSGLIGG